MTETIVNDLIKFKTFSNNLVSLQKKFTERAKSVLNLDLINNTVINEIKICRSDGNIIESTNDSKDWKCFRPKCGFKTKYRIQLKTHQMIHSNERPFKCR